MSPILFFLVLLLAAVFAGMLGSLLGLGGGVIIVPLLTLAFGVPPLFAIGASIVSVIATSSGAASAYVRDRITNLRIGMFLEIATTTGAITGAILTLSLVKANLEGVIYVTFGVVLLLSILPLLRQLGEELPGEVQPDYLSRRLELSGEYHDAALNKDVRYQATRSPMALAIMYVAGLISGLLGIGSGVLKVIALDVGMKLPMKVSSTTSNFMIGVTAAASTGIFYLSGYINPFIAAPVTLGVVVGSMVGTRTLRRSRNTSIRKVFIPIIVILAVEMLLHGV
ncbi:MAG: sulfite exporter TauE/SafE family protein [Nitrososphaerota archaeon]|nr:sulfite exporter TauE/SafE family protein [Nitrososphaerota archaeon]